MQEMREQGVTQIILDLRSNPGGHVDQALEISEKIVPEGRIISTFDRRIGSTEYLSTLRTPPFERVFILTDQHTASAAEIIASALQDSGIGTVIGRHTYGKGLIQGTFELTFSLGGAVTMTVQEYFRRNGMRIDEIGITPNIQVEFVREIPEIAFRLHDTSPEIPNIRNALTLLGYEAGNSGNLFDMVMQGGLLQFQKDQQIWQTGMLDLVTIHALNRAVAEFYTNNDVVLDRAILEATR